MKVAVVTGGAVGLGAALAEELGRQGMYVVTLDPGVNAEGAAGTGEHAVGAQRIIDAGGQARAAKISVTDAAAVETLFSELVEEFGAVDTVVNVAGNARAAGFASGSEDDWSALLSVHLGGYLNVLGAALPRMAAAGHGRILGVTSGSGWRLADVGGYSCGKRAVAALTWQLGKAVPDGVSVNALSPMAATRTLKAALSAASAQGGVALGGALEPEHLGPIGAYLAGERLAAISSGNVLFTNGAEITRIAGPKVLEVVRTTGVTSIGGLLDRVVPTVLVPAEAAQAGGTAGPPRLTDAFGTATSGGSAGRRGVVVTDRAEWRAAITGALVGRGIECVAVDDPAMSFQGAADQLAAAANGSTVDAVVVALSNGAGPGSGPAWQQLLDEHAGIVERIHADAAWARAVADHSIGSNRPVRLAMLVDATTGGGRSRAQAVAQLSRAAHMATADQVDAFAIGVEASSALAHAAELAAYLLAGADVAGLSGGELFVAENWLGLRSHPYTDGTVSFGGPELPDWLDDAVRMLVGN